MRKMSRRDFVKQSCCSAAAGMAAASFGRLGLMNAMAQSSTDYKALVCIFMFGGNDANNLIVPNDSAGYANYASIRAGLALPQSQLLSVTPPRLEVHSDFPPSLVEVQKLFTSKKLALLTNVGTLVQPTTRTQFLQGQGTLPQNLFSHADQQTQMQTAVQATLANAGWADWWRTRSNLFTAATSLSRSLWQEPTFLSKDWHSAPWNRAVTRRRRSMDFMDPARTTPVSPLCPELADLRYRTFFDPIGEYGDFECSE